MAQPPTSFALNPRVGASRVIPRHIVDHGYKHDIDKISPHRKDRVIQSPRIGAGGSLAENSAKRVIQGAALN